MLPHVGIPFHAGSIPIIDPTAHPTALEQPIHGQPAVWAINERGGEIHPRLSITTGYSHTLCARWVGANTLDVGRLPETIINVTLSGRHYFPDNVLAEAQRLVNLGVAVYLGIPPENPQKYLMVATAEQLRLARADPELALKMIVPGVSPQEHSKNPTRPTAERLRRTHLQGSVAILPESGMNRTASHVGRDATHRAGRQPMVSTRRPREQLYRNDKSPSPEHGAPRVRAPAQTRTDEAPAVSPNAAIEPLVRRPIGSPGWGRVRALHSDAEGSESGAKYRVREFGDLFEEINAKNRKDVAYAAMTRITDTPEKDSRQGRRDFVKALNNAWTAYEDVRSAIQMQHRRLPLHRPIGQLESAMHDCLRGLLEEAARHNVFGLRKPVEDLDAFVRSDQFRIFVGAVNYQYYGNLLRQGLSSFVLSDTHPQQESTAGSSTIRRFARTIDESAEGSDPGDWYVDITEENKFTVAYTTLARIVESGELTLGETQQVFVDALLSARDACLAFHHALAARSSRLRQDASAPELDSVALESTMRERVRDFLAEAAHGNILGLDGPIQDIDAFGASDEFLMFANAVEQVHRHFLDERGSRGQGWSA